MRWLVLVGLLFGLSVAAVSAQSELVELEAEVNGEEQILEIDPADGPVQGVIVDMTVTVEGLVAYETEDGWELAPETFVTTIGPDSPLFGMEVGDSWVITPAEEEPLDGEA